VSCDVWLVETDSKLEDIRVIDRIEICYDRSSNDDEDRKNNIVGFKSEEQRTQKN